MVAWGGGRGEDLFSGIFFYFLIASINYNILYAFEASTAIQSVEILRVEGGGLQDPEVPFKV